MESQSVKDCREVYCNEPYEKGFENPIQVFIQSRWLSFLRDNRPSNAAQEKQLKREGD